MADNQVITKRKLSIIDNWRQGWKWASVRTSALGIGVMGAAQVLGSTWAGLPPSIQERIPHADVIAMVLFGVALVGRFFKLEKGETTNDENSSG
jgi:hypothetical protein